MPSQLPLTEPTEASWRVTHDLVRLRTIAPLQFIDVTEEIARRVRRSGVSNGLVNVQTLHTTTGVVVNEHEPMLLADLTDALRRWAPELATYRHDDPRLRVVNLEPGERANGHAHARALLLGASQTLSVIGGTAQLGRWQRIFLVELDGPRTRALRVTVMGATGPEPGGDRLLEALEPEGTGAGR